MLKTRSKLQMYLGFTYDWNARQCYNLFSFSYIKYTQNLLFM